MMSKPLDRSAKIRADAGDDLRVDYAGSMPPSSVMNSRRFIWIELHSSRSVRAALQITQMSRGQTAGGEMILQPCQPLVHNPLTDATTLDDRFSAAPSPAVMTPIRRARLSPALDQACRSLR